MKIVILKPDKTIVDIYENVQNPVITGNKVTWEYGEIGGGDDLSGVAIVDDTEAVEVGGMIDLTKDKKDQFRQPTVEETAQKNSQDLIDVQLALTELYQMILALQK